METETEKYGLLKRDGDELYFTEMRLSGDRWSLTLVNGKAVLAEEKDILRWPTSSESKDSRVGDKTLINRPRNTEDKIQSEPPAPGVKPIKSEVSELPADWLRGCEICNSGLCRKMDELTASSKKGGVGLPIREAAKRLEEQAEKEIGEKIWTAEQIRARYLYHTAKMVPGRNSTTTEKMTPSVEKTDHPPDPIPQEGAGRKTEYLYTETHEVTYAMQFAIMAISQLERIDKDDPRKEDALTKVELWILKHRGRSADLEGLKVLYKTFLDAVISFQHNHRHRKREWRKQLSEIVGWIQNIRTLTNTWAEQFKDK